jgi:hypothetical protein
LRKQRGAYTSAAAHPIAPDRHFRLHKIPGLAPTSPSSLTEQSVTLSGLRPTSSHATTAILYTIFAKAARTGYSVEFEFGGITTSRFLGTTMDSVVSWLTRILLVALFSAGALAQSNRGLDNSASNLMVVLRESGGQNKQDESLVAFGKIKARLADGKDIEMEPAWFAYLGDMHVRFVFDSPTHMLNAEAADLSRLGLSPQAALDLAVSNVRRVYGEPKATPWNELMQVKGKSPDLDSTYFLDRTFWLELLKQHPEGVVALVAKRGGLLYAPLSNEKAVSGMKRSVGYLHSSSGAMRVSSALYLFKDGKWSVYQAPQPAR